VKRLLLLFASAALILNVSPGAFAEGGAPELIKGARVLTAGHSFHVWMPGILKQVAASAGIVEHETVDIQSIGGSRVIQHWDLPEGKNKIKPALLAGKADVLTLSPIFVPDPGIENFVKLGLEHNPALRVTVQEFWMPYDDQATYLARPARVPPSSWRRDRS
jgi:hypothetical protein